MSVWIRRNGVDWEVDEGTAEEKHLLATGGEIVPAPKPAAKPRGRKAAAKTDDDDEGSTLE